MEPMVEVEGVGAVELPVPPIALAYQSKFEPPAVNGGAVWF